MLVRGMV